MEPVIIPPRLITVNVGAKASSKVRHTRSNHIVVVTNATDSEVAVDMNQKLLKIYFTNSTNCVFQILDSAVLGTREVVCANLKNCTLMFDEVDVRVLRMVDCENFTVQFGDSETNIENCEMYWYGRNVGNKVQRTIIKPGTDPNKFNVLPVLVVDSLDVVGSSGATITFGQLENGKALKTKVNTDASNLTLEDIEASIAEMREMNKAIEDMPTSELGKLYEQEIEEYEETPEELARKVKIVADAIRKAKHSVVYTGAGISTAAKLPDYRGPQGVWTLRANGNIRNGPSMELGSAMPTYAHYAITELIRKQLVSFVTSTNLDGLHVRSGTVRGKISELHGNCYLEICELCEREYLRSFDTLPTRVDRWSHHTGRLCDCGGHLRDTIVHFTENIRRSEWASAVTNARLSDVALVLGTSMNVQPAASLPDKCLKNNGSLFIVNLQRTPYDEFATLKIYAKTDDFMFALMKELGDEEFNMNYDHCVTLATQEKRALIKKWVYRTASLSAGLAAAGALGYYLLRNKQFSLPAFFRRN